MAAAVNCGEIVCTIGICYVVNQILLPSKYNVKLQKNLGKPWLRSGIFRGVVGDFFRGRGGGHPPAPVAQGAVTMYELIP
jgi:hypothetical protein